MKIIYIIIGLISLVIGGVGAVMPLLPTTPFLFVTAYCFAKSSDRLNDWFKSTQLYKNYLESFAKGEGMPVRAKVRILLTITLLLSIGAYCMRHVTYGYLILLAVWVIHIVVFTCCIKTAKEDSAT